MLLFASILIRNFPEGLTVETSSVQSIKLGVFVGFGIFIHNISEGIDTDCCKWLATRTWMNDAAVIGGAPFGFLGLPERLYEEYCVSSIYMCVLSIMVRTFSDIVLY